MDQKLLTNNGQWDQILTEQRKDGDGTTVGQCWRRIESLASLGTGVRLSVYHSVEDEMWHREGSGQEPDKDGRPPAGQGGGKAFR